MSGWEKRKDDLFYACLESWQKHLSDYKIMEWNEKHLMSLVVIKSNKP